MTSTTRTYWRNRGLALLIALGVLAALTLDHSPALPESAPPSASDAIAARSVFNRFRKARGKEAEPVMFSWAELDTVARLGARSAGYRRIAVERDGTSIVARASMALPLGFWSNGALIASAGEGGQPELSARIGRLPLPSFIAHPMIDLARYVLSWRRVDVPPIREIVSGLEVGDTGVTATLTLPRDSGLVQALNGARPDAVDPQLVGETYCRLAKRQRATPTEDFATQTRWAFAAAGGPAENRAAFVALAMLAVSPKVGQLVGDPVLITQECKTVASDPKLLGRVDLAKHWALSAALTATLGPDASLAMGTWKELADSARGGSGFSYVDLAADRAGVRAALRASDPAQAKATADWLAKATETRLLPVAALALSEGMSEAEFAARYANVESAAYDAAVARVDRALAEAAP